MRDPQADSVGDDSLPIAYVALFSSCTILSRVPFGVRECIYVVGLSA